MKELKQVVIFLTMLMITVLLSKFFNYGIAYYLGRSGNSVLVQYTKMLLSVIHPIFILIINIYLAILIFRDSWKDSKLFIIFTVFFGVLAPILFHLFSIKVDIEGFLINNDKNKAMGRGMAWILVIYILIIFVATFSKLVYSIAYPSIYELFTFKIKTLGFLAIILSEVFNIGLGIWMFYAAKKDSQNSIFWGVLGYFQGLLALIFYFLCIKQSEAAVTNQIDAESAK